ncbi:ABC transporter [Intrasporangium oryzae NRRL B-24470]|uniref:ABC transporter n=2 Tax=Intrasporangium TaxID=53357 RepID=W9G861_9MICO|nr:ABC transporter [Intrasporangium oryzae NRRL B-24470]
MGRAKVARVSATELADRTTALSMALLSGSDELDPGVVEQARRVVDKAFERTNLAGDHTVVALAGATGSGKSSLFNALVGADVATIGARRPTTAKPTAAIWGGGDAGELLDWLHVDARHRVEDDARPTGRGKSVGSLDGLVLLDLPDFDSRELAHRQEAERILELVDVFVWVTDPQKYADARLHDEFVSILSRHDAVTVAVLNQSDRLTPDAVQTVAKDLRRLLLADGVKGAQVLTTSTLTGDGIPEFRQRLANAVAGHAASRQRLRADVVGVAERLRQDVADTEPDVAKLSRTALDEAFARAAGVPVVLDAVERDYRREAFAHTGFLFARWTKAFAADPLRRLGLDRDRGRDVIPLDIEGADVRAVLGRSSIPAPTLSTVAAVDIATREFVRNASEGMPPRWGEAVDAAVDRGEGALSDRLDRAVMSTSLRARRPIWWFVVNVLQWLLGLAAIAGLVWLAVLVVMGWLQLPRIEAPTVGVIPLPLLMLVGGLLVGLGLAVVSRWWANIGARRRKASIGRRLTEAVGEVADERVLIPIDEVHARHRATRAHLAEASD